MEVPDNLKALVGRTVLVKSSFVGGTALIPEKIKLVTMMEDLKEPGSFFPAFYLEEKGGGMLDGYLNEHDFLTKEQILSMFGGIEDQPWQTRNVDGELKFHQSIDGVIASVLADPTISKISYGVGEGRVRLLKDEVGTWQATFQSQILGVIFVDRLETSR